jgi:hypothetical protein
VLSHPRPRNPEGCATGIQEIRRLVDYEETVVRTDYGKRSARARMEGRSRDVLANPRIEIGRWSAARHMRAGEPDRLTGRSGDGFTGRPGRSGRFSLIDFVTPLISLCRVSLASPISL